jgi:hypothetical protein
MKFVFLFLAFFIFSCASSQKRSIQVNNGDSKEKVISIMGNPENRQFNGSKEAWQYCDTSFGHYNFAVVYFYEEKVTAVTTYSGSPTPFSGCEHHFDPVNWEPKTGSR